MQMEDTRDIDIIIIIRPADKGSGITIIDTKDYKDTTFQELSDSSTYKQTSEDRTKKITNKINRTVNDLFKSGIIDSELKHYMDRVKRIWYLSPMRAAKVQASLRIRAVSPEPPLLAHTSSESRGTFR